MDKDVYVRMNSEELYDSLISHVMDDPIDGKRILEELELTKRFETDYAFRASVGTAKAILLGVIGETEALIPLCMDLLQTTNAFGMWQLVSTNWNMLGTAYSALDIYEKAFECYHNVIKIEQEHGLKTMSSAAYNNIAQIYINLDDFNEAYNYLLLAVEKLEEGGKKQLRYKSKFLSYYSNIILSLCKLNKEKEIQIAFEKLKNINLEDVNITSKCNFYLAGIYYAFSKKQYDEAKTVFIELRDIVRQHNEGILFSVVSVYLELCLTYKLDHSYYADELLMFASLDVPETNPDNLSVYYRALRNYYRSVGDLDSLKKVSDKYIDFLEKNDRSIKEQRRYSLHMMKKLMDDNEDIADIKNRNVELKLIAKEAVRNKDALQEAYHRIEMINELGRKMTSSLDLDEVVGLIYKNIKEALPVDAFVLMVVEKDKKQLRSLAYYEDEKLQKNFSIDLSDKNSIFVDCYHLNGIISSTDPKYREYFKKHMEMQEEADMKSAIFMTLNVGSEIVGLCSIQDRKDGAYTQREIEFLTQLLPYLSISLNNAVHSWVLEKEIQSHLDTRSKLEAANKRLEKISSLDGLTQISSRRDFDTRVIELLEESKSRNESFSVFMIDIDDFKLYNDTYGHLEGDEALKKVARVFREKMDGVEGLSARFGGEEFIGACVGPDYKESLALAEDIRKAVIDLDIEHKTSRIKKVTVSIGVAIAEDVDKKVKSNMLKFADEALYKAKNSGKNKVEIIFL